jgi:hypothetical protein
MIIAGNGVHAVELIELIDISENVIAFFYDVDPKTFEKKFNKFLILNNESDVKLNF